jgi:hypothetical protein
MELDALPPLPTMVDAIDVGERFAAIDAIQSMIRGTAEGMDDVEALGPLRRGVLDWNLILRMFNEHFDRVVSILEQPRFADRARLMQELSAELDDRAEQRREPMDLIIGAILNRRETVSRHIGEILVALLSPSHDMAIVAQTRSLARLDLSRLAFALAACRAESGSYPDTLDTVVPEHLAEMPLDPFVDRPFHYERSAEGFRLYSVGDNMIDDGGRTFDSEPRGDDILIETPRPPKDGVEPGVAEK